eukprot:TRINITY_DN3068_c0_g2_i1.p1 TRINITY_DN3068_c0_g2~~TRINITY_DN3068_c0_g2_i1.p1  ORF type:complete len:239 (+),score=53.59 TRINITY_DN3068_c0_g2_i1:100-816(+)
MGNKKKNNLKMQLGAAQAYQPLNPNREFTTIPQVVPMQAAQVVTVQAAPAVNGCRRNCGNIEKRFLASRIRGSIFSIFTLVATANLGYRSLYASKSVLIEGIWDKNPLAVVYTLVGFSLWFSTFGCFNFIIGCFRKARCSFAVCALSHLVTLILWIVAASFLLIYGMTSNNRDLFNYNTPYECKAATIGLIILGGVIYCFGYILISARNLCLIRKVAKFQKKQKKQQQQIALIGYPLQ